MSVVQAFLLVGLGAAFVIAGFAIAVNKISAGHDRRARARYMRAYYVDTVDQTTSFTAYYPDDNQPPYLPERMW
jgi:hypothetical protein